jgi:hypothetical protein
MTGVTRLKVLSVDVAIVLYRFPLTLKPAR